MDGVPDISVGKTGGQSHADALESQLEKLSLQQNVIPAQRDGSPPGCQTDVPLHRPEQALINIMSDGPKEGDDTVIFLKPPPQTPDQSKKLYEAIQRRYQWPLFGRSSAFMQYAPEFHQTYFSATYQPRYRRRFASRLREHPTWNLRYILDLTPAIEGDEAIEAVTQLQCPKGVLIWHLSTARFGCSGQLVNGHPDLETDVNVQAYSQIRHSLAIERLLLALHGHNPQFDSAVKLYSTAMLSRQFGVTSGPLQDWVISWFGASNNTVFTEVMPEATLAMADSLQVGCLAVEAFAILLGESCLELKAGIRTIHNRLRYEIDEGWQSRLQYAKQSFETRVESAFEALVQKSMLWIEDTLEYRKLLNARDAAIACNLEHVWDTVVLNLKDMVRGVIYNYLHVDLAEIPGHIFEGDESRAANALYGFIGYRAVWGALPAKKRIFTRLFWFMMTRIRIGQFGDPNRDSRHEVVPATPDGFRFSPGRVNWSWENLGSLGQIDRGLSSLKIAFMKVIETSMDPTSLRFRPGNGGYTEPWEKRSYYDQSMMRSALTEIEEYSTRSFFRQVEQKIAQQAWPMLQMPPGSTTRPTELQVTNVLLCLNEEETRYLPLWAGGNDDGTGGVFEIEVPQAVDGFSSHGPFIHRENDSHAGSEYSYVSRSTNVPSSVEVDDGFSDTLDRRRVYTASEADSDISWTDVLEHRNRSLPDHDDVVSLPETAINHGETSHSSTDRSDCDISEDSFEVVDE